MNDLNSRIMESYMRISADLGQSFEFFKLTELLCEKFTTPYILDLHSKIFLDPRAAQMYERRFMPEVDLDALAQLPAGTFGREYADFCRRYGLNQDFYPEVSTADFYGYFAMRGRRTHDMLHVLTGYEPNNLGEIGVQAFSLAQIGNSPIDALFVSAGIFNIINNTPNQIHNSVAIVGDAYNRGRRAQTLTLSPLEDWWDVSLARLRQKLEIIPPSAEYGITTELFHGGGFLDNWGAERSPPSDAVRPARAPVPREETPTAL